MGHQDTDFGLKASVEVYFGTVLLVVEEVLLHHLVFQWVKVEEVCCCYSAGDNVDRLKILAVNCLHFEGTAESVAGSFVHSAGVLGS